MVKLAALALALGVIVIYLKNVNSELFLLALIGSGIVLVYSAVEYFITTIDFFSTVILKTGVKSEYFEIIFKCVAIGYLTEFAAGTLADAGLNSLSSKVVLIGKAVILSVSLPIIYAVFNLLTGLLQ